MPGSVVWTGRLAFVVGEVLLVQQYIARGTAWHGLIHSLAGFAAGLAVAALLSAARREPTRGLGWAAVGQLVSVAPDILYIARNLPHKNWMDIFVGHIAVHTAWAPVLLTFGCFAAAGWGWWLVSAADRRTTGVVLTVVAGAIFAAALVNADPVPSRLVDFPAAGADPSMAYATPLYCRR